MPVSHLLLALIIMAVWGLNFIAMRWALDAVAPMTFAALRFFVVLVPLIFFVPRPKVPLRLLLGYASSSFSLQFCLIFLAVSINMPVGLISLVVQGQVFFSIGLAILIYRDRPSRWQIIGVSVGTLGIAAVGADLGQTMPLLAFIVTLCGALSWAVGNTFVKAMGPVSAISLVVWASLIAVATLIPVSLVIEGTASWGVALRLLAQGDLVFWGSLLFNGFGASLLGYGGWSWLLRRHATALIAPFTLLVPVFGLGSAAIILGEELRPGSWPGIIMVFVGLGLSQVSDPRSWPLWRRSGN
ncbi:MAG: putative rane protein [Pseudomonadota bacterium]|jgi:O-acetylserine/cysteine efflux transporter